MRIFVIGLDCAAPEIVFTHDKLPNLRKLMTEGCHGRLESVYPPITVPAWMCMATSQDPGSLGVYGFRNRSSHAYDGLTTVNSTSITAPAIWDYLEAYGKRSVIVGVPPSYPPRKVNGVSVGCFLTPDTAKFEYTHPPEVKSTIRKLVGAYPVDVSGFRTNDKVWLKDQIYEMTRKHFEVVRHLMVTVDWQYFQFVEIGVDRVHHGFWKFHDREHRQFTPGMESVILDYYEYVDREIGDTLELLEDDDIVLAVSDHGAQRLDGGFCINEWLIREGLLTLTARPDAPVPLRPAMVDWAKTKVWSEGGYYARIFVNVEGREPNGIVSRREYPRLLDDLQRRLEALVDDRGEPMHSGVYRPYDIYQRVERVPPDLIVHLGQLYWRSIGSVGQPGLYIQENDTGPDDCNHAQFGMFVLKAPGLDVHGEVGGMRLLDIAPTLLDLAGHPVPPAMQGRPLRAQRSGPRA